VLGALAAAAHQGSPAALLARKGRLIAVEPGPAREDAVSRIQELTLLSSAGLRVRALLRVPKAGEGRGPAAVIVGGIQLGRRIATAAGLDRIARQTVIVSPDYPLEQRRHTFEGLSLLTTLPYIRPAAFDSVAQALLLLDYLETRPDVDPRRLFLVGGSMGAPIVTIAGGVDRRPAAVVVLYGGGQLAALIAHTLEQPGQPRPYPHWAAVVTGQGLAWLFAPLAPERYAPAIAPRRFLMINGAGDSLVPRANVLALYDAARQPKELIWVEGEHIQPEETALIAHVSSTVSAWLEKQGLLTMGRSP
jgi:dienelactone hydrolase